MASAGRQATVAEGLSVAELADQIARALRGGLPEQVWVRGEVFGCKAARSGGGYFQLVERRDGRTVAAVSACVLGRDRRRFDADLAAAPSLRFGDGLEVLVRGRVSFYGPSGGVQLLVDGIDPAYTLGKAAAARERLLAALAAEGLLRRNAAHPLPLAPLRVGLVTAAGSDAAADVITRLERSGYAFQVLVADARVQGDGCETSVVDALRLLVRAHRRDPLDVVVVTRGGGGRSDLAGFDGEQLARAITACPWPVFTGIGHQQDRTVADEVAHTACPTPTAAAAALIERVATAADAVAQLADRAAVRAAAQIERERARVEAAARGVTAAGRLLARMEATVDGLAARRDRAPHTVLARAEQRLHDLTRHQQRAAATVVTHAGARLDGIAPRLDALAPERVLARGYSITRTQTGAVVRAADQVGAGDLLVTTLASGSVAAVALPHPGDLQPDPPAAAGPRPRRPRRRRRDDSQLDLFATHQEPR